MSREAGVVTAKGGFLIQTYQKYGISGCWKKIWAAIKMNVPLWLMGRRTPWSVAAYFDLITDDARLFYGDSFHFGYFSDGIHTLEAALQSHTHLVADMACLQSAQSVLDVGCGICVPAVSIAQRYPVHITGINISQEQVRQGEKVVASHNLTQRITVRVGNALALEFPENSFDAVLCLEVAGDICVTAATKKRLVAELHRVVKPGGTVGFSDLVFTHAPTPEEEKSLRMILYHEGKELVTDWPKLFRDQGFAIEREIDILKDTMPTWDHSIAVYEERRSEVEKRYGKRVAHLSLTHLRRLPAILSRYGAFVVFSARKHSLTSTQKSM